MYWRRIKTSVILLLLSMTFTGCRQTRQLPEETETQGSETVMEQSENPSLFADRGFEKLISDFLDFPENATDEEKIAIMAQTDSLEFSHMLEIVVESWEDLAYFPALRELSITYYTGGDGSDRVDFSGIGLAEGLEKLNMSNQNPENIDFLQKLPNLKELYLINCGLTDVSPLAELVWLERLSLYRNAVRDATPLENLINLVELTLNENSVPLQNYNVLAKLTDMEDLGLDGCGLKDIEFVRSMPELKSAFLDDNGISDISPLTECKKLELVSLRGNEISDISALAGLTNLYALDLDYNKITDISVLKDLMSLSSLGIMGNKIQDVSCLEDKDRLFLLNLGRNPVKDITQLFGIPCLIFRNQPELFDKELKTEVDFAQEWIEENVQELAYYIIEDISTGDLNQDGLKDMALVISELTREEMPVAENGSDIISRPVRVTLKEVWDDDLWYGDRSMYLFLGQENGCYRRIEHDLELLSHGLGGTRGDPYSGILIGNGYLLYKEAGGSRSGWQNTEYYRYRNNKLEIIRNISLSDDNFAVGYDVFVTDYLEKTTKRYIYAVRGDYDYKKLSMDGSDSLNGQPIIDLYDGSYLYFEDLRTSGIAPEEALEMAVGVVDDILKEENLMPVTGKTAEKQEIGYTTGLKENYERLKGIALPDYYYGLNDTEGKELMICYNRYDLKEGLGYVHEILLKYQKPEKDYQSYTVIREIYVIDQSGEVIWN